MLPPHGAWVIEASPVVLPSGDEIYLSYSGLRFDVMNKLNAHGGLFVGQKATAAAGAHM